MNEFNLAEALKLMSGGGQYSTPTGVPQQQQQPVSSISMSLLPQGFQQAQGASMLDTLTKPDLLNQQLSQATGVPLQQQNQSLFNMGNLGSVLQGAGALAQSWMGMKGLGLAQDQFDFTKSAWQQQYADSRAAYKKEIEDREARRESARK